MRKLLFVAAIGLGLTAYAQAENCENRSAPAGYHYTADCRLVKDPSTSPNWYRGGGNAHQ